MTDTKTNTKNGTKSKVYNLRSAMLEFQKLAVTLGCALLGTVFLLLVFVSVMYDLHYTDS